MTPYYSDEWVTLYLADAAEAIASMSAESVDCVMTDLPYDDRTHAMARSSSRHAPAGGRALSGSRAAFAAWPHDRHVSTLAALGRISRGWVITTLATSTAFRIDADPPDGLHCLRVAVWVKTNPMPIYSGDRPAMGWEPIVCLHRADRKPRWNGGGRPINYVGAKCSDGYHPTQKPVPLIAGWVDAFTDHRDTILDPFAGSGSTLVAAKMLGRKAIGVEIEERYCEIAARRLSQGVLDFGDSA